MRIAVGAAGAAALAAVILHSVSAPRLGWIALALALQAASMITFARLQQRVLASSGLRLPLSTSLAIAFAGNAVAVTVPFAGTTASAAFTHRQYVQHGATGTMAGWAMALAGVYSTIAFATLSGVGALANGNPIAAIAGGSAIIGALVPVVAVVIAVRSRTARDRLERVLGRALRITKRVVHRPRAEPADVAHRSTEQLATFHLSRRDLFGTTSLAVLNWVFDALCLWVVLHAFAVSMPVTDLSLVYSAAIAAASLSITPAGIGTVEAAIAVTLTSLGSDGLHALPAAIAYRAISTWLVLAIGWLILVQIRRRPVAATMIAGAAAAESVRVEAIGLDRWCPPAEPKLGPCRPRSEPTSTTTTHSSHLAPCPT